MSPVLALGAVLAACDAGRSSAVDFPDDAQIVSALRADFTEDPNNARARTLITQLGGEKGTLDYAIRRVVSRQGAFEAHYDVTLRMGQAGDASLSQLYAQMIPAEEAAKLPQPVTLAEQEKWLRQQAEALQKSSPQEGAALAATLDALGPCYREAKAGDSVTLMTGLAALLSPTRDGWYAERLQSPRVELRCLPA
ncbi:MAG: hypothetical protein EOO29_10405 [Comamonadaceae bacterium]|nr:MAG: hypothetical protein EOO29_10405 [Comamonadaceae bacterium]